MITWEDIKQAQSKATDKCAKLGMKMIHKEIKPLDAMNIINETFTDTEKAFLVERFIYRTLLQTQNQMLNSMPIKDDLAFQ